jgi:hypothetical protein
MADMDHVAWPDLTHEQLLQMFDEGTCLFCGAGPFRHVGIHICVKHGVTMDALREHYGLNRTQRTCSAAVAEIQQEVQRRLMQDDAHRSECVDRLRAARRGRPPMREQGRQHLSAVKDAGKRVDAVCEVCGASFRDYPYSRSRYCSAACRNAAAGARLTEAFVERQTTDPAFAARMNEVRAKNARSPVRRGPPRLCTNCGREFWAPKGRKTCSDACRREIRVKTARATLLGGGGD